MRILSVFFITCFVFFPRISLGGEGFTDERGVRWSCVPGHFRATLSVHPDDCLKSPVESFMIYQRALSSLHVPARVSPLNQNLQGGCSLPIKMLYKNNAFSRKTQNVIEVTFRASCTFENFLAYSDIKLSSTYYKLGEAVTKAEGVEDWDTDLIRIMKLAKSKVYPKTYRTHSDLPGIMFLDAAYRGGCISKEIHDFLWKIVLKPEV